MTNRRHSLLGVVSLATAALCVMAAIGCNKPQEGTGGGPGGPAGPGGPPMGGRGPMGGPGGMMGGPGGRRGGPGGMMGRGQPVAANATASEIFQSRCQFCHGAQGQGGRGPALTNLSSRSDSDLHKVIHDGRDNGKMPAFGSQMTDAQIDKVVKYLKGLSAKPSG